MLLGKEIQMSAEVKLLLGSKKDKHMLMALSLCFCSCFAGTALSALPQVLISMLFLCLGGPCNEGPTLAQPEE